MYKSHTEKLLSCIQRRKQRFLLWELLNFLDPLLRSKLGIMLLFGNMEMIQLGTKNQFCYLFLNCYETQILFGLDCPGVIFSSYYWCRRVHVRVMSSVRV